MISFRNYLMENKKQYAFNVRLACECTKESIETLKTALDKFGLAGISKHKESPVAETHRGFEHVKNVRLTTFTIMTDYPATPVQIQSMIKDYMNVDESLIMVSTPGEDEIAAPVVPQEALGKDYEEAKEKSMLVDLESALDVETTEFEFAEDSKEKGETTNDLEQGNESPIGS